MISAIMQMRFVTIAILLSVASSDFYQTYDIQNSILDSLKGREQLVFDTIVGAVSSELDYYGIALEQIEGLQDLSGLLDEDVENTTACTMCKTAIGALKALVAATDSWEDMRDPVVQVCYVLFENFTDEYVNTDVLCPGTIDGQGPHIYEVLRPIYGKSPEHVCRNLNLCLELRDTQLSLISPIEKQSAVEKPRRSLADRKANALTVAHLSDIHMELRYEEGTSTECGLPVCCIPAYGPGDAGAYGDYLCNIPQRTMELFFHKIVEFNPSFILFSGDTPPHALWDETYDSQLNCTARLVESAETILANYSLYPNIGNHEMYPTNLFSMEFLQPYTQNLTAEFAELWTDLAGFGEEQQETMSTGGYYTVLAMPGLRILSFNTNYWYVFNWYNILNEGEPEVEDMKIFMQETFEAARQNQEKVILIGHHLPGYSGSITHQTRQFEELVLAYSDVILFQVAGHTHNDHFRVFSDDLGDAIATTFVNPTVGTNSNKNPSMRLFYLDPDTYELIDYEQWGYDMMDLIESLDDPNIELIYSAVDEYQLADMSPASWQQFTQRMETDDELFAQYNRHYSTRYFNATSCDDACRIQRLCDTQFYSFDLYLDCVQNPYWEFVL